MSSPRAAAISTIATVAPESHATIDALLRALKDEDKMVRFVAAIHFGGLSDPRAKAAVPELVSVVMDESVDHLKRARAARLLGEQKASAAVPVLIEAIQKEGLGGVACWALGEIGAPARAAIPILEEFARTNRFHRVLVTQALTKIQGEELMDDEQE